MKSPRYLIASLTSALAVSAWAQTTPSALNLNLPPNRAATSAPSAAPAGDANKSPIAAVTTTAASTPALQNLPASSAQYDAKANAIVDAADSRASTACDDAAYGHPRIHGSIGMGVVAGNHINGNYQTASVRMSKALGSCDHPTGGTRLTINVGQGRFNGRNYGLTHW
ncbi:MAG: hypothetical protein ACRECA_10890 [Pseudolabrys sp.]